ncbi:MAG: hypothetical protein LBT09_01760 [Planctomycetaceae bacterium]|nr:hypothetical protein [Planctomycetaceae bacterium]
MCDASLIFCHGKQNLNQQIQNNLKGKIMIPPIGERYAKIGIKKGITIGESRGMKRGINIGESRGIKKGIDIGESRGIEKGITIGESRGVEKGINIGESRGITIGEARGIAKGKAEGIISILDVKFGEISETVRDSLYAVTDNDRLKNLLRFAAKCESFEEFDNELKSTK